MVNKIKVIIKSVDVELIGELFETETTKKVWEILPVTSSVKTWGDEIYYDIPVTLSLEKDARANVEIGEIGYWDVGKCMCIFFGRTPASKGEKPVAASPVNVFGKIIGDSTVLKQVNDGDEVIVQKA